MNSIKRVNGLITTATPSITASRFASTSSTLIESIPSTSSSSSIPILSTSASRSKAKSLAFEKMIDTVAERRAAKVTSSLFTNLGSTQNRKTTWNPHQTLHSPPTPPALTQSHLVAACAHLGHSPTHTHRSFFPLIYGTRSNISYIDLRQTLPQLRTAAQIVKSVVERDGIVIFVGSLKGAERAVWENAARLGENGFGVTKWLAGSISNSKEIFGWCEIRNPQKNSGNAAAHANGGRREKEGPKLSPASFKPSLLVLLSPTLNQHALREAMANEIPTIGICDSDVDPRCVTYAIPANDDSPRAVELIAGVLGMAGKDGLRRKHERMAQEALMKQRRAASTSQARLAGDWQKN